MPIHVMAATHAEHAFSMTHAEHAFSMTAAIQGRGRDRDVGPWMAGSSLAME
jgi:hypothetical protein